MKLLIGTTIAALALAPGLAGAQPRTGAAAVAAPRVALFSPQRAFAGSEEGKAGLARLQELQERRAREIDERRQALQARERALSREAAAADDPRALTREVERLRLGVDRLIEDAQVELAAMRREIERTFFGKVGPAVDRIARTKDLQLVLNADDDLVVWADAAVDITPDVVAALAKPAVPTGESE